MLYGSLMPFAIKHSVAQSGCKGIMLYQYVWSSDIDTRHPFPPKSLFFVTIGTSTAQNQSPSSTADLATASPSLTSMLLNQSSGDASESRETNRASQQQQSKAAPVQEDEDHISKLDIRVGIVRSVTAHPDAESLYIEQSKTRLGLG